MGLREDADAAYANAKRIQEENEADLRRIAEENRKQERRKHEADAKELMSEFGVAVDRMGWNGDLLYVRSEDGVWLRWYPSSVGTAGFIVVDKCPTCDEWVARAHGIAQDLAKIGAQLRMSLTMLSLHHRQAHEKELP